MNESSHVEPRAEWVRPTRWVILAAAGALCVITLLVGSVPTKVIGFLIAATTVQGVLLGGRTILAVVLGLLVSAIIGLPIGRAVGSQTGSMLGQSGLVGYGVGLLVIVAITGLIATVVFRFVIAKATSTLDEDREQLLRDIDVPAGGVLGLLQGCVLSLLVIWGIGAVRPIAVFQAEQAQQPGAVPNPAAERVVKLTAGFESSVPGTLAAATNPIADLTVFDIANDFIVVMNDPKARERFESDPLFDEISSMPSVTSALEIIKADPLVGAAIERQQLGGQLASDLLRSDAVVQALRQTSVVDDLTPYVDRIRDALRAARELVE